MMKKILSVAFLNFIQGIREKVFWLVIFFFIFILGVTFFMGLLSPGETSTVLRAAGLSGIELSGILLVIFGLTFSFYREKDYHLTELALSYFSKPTYIGGKIIGHILICLFYLVLALLGLSVILILNKAFSFVILAGIFAIFLKLSIIIGVSLIFCCLFSSYLLAMFSSLFIYFASEVSQEALRIISLSGSEFLKHFFRFLYQILPNMDKLDIKSSVIYGQLPTSIFFITITLYSLLYILFLWSLASFIFLNKED